MTLHSTSWLERLRPWHVIALAGLVRTCLICWAEYQDLYLSVKYTDIDYVVFTDAARFVATGGSPYRRSTYRYSPLLAYLLLPNIWLHPAWGKVLFSVSDLVAAGLLLFLLRCAAAPQPLLTAAMLVWLFNPYTATISTRGSCDVLSVLLLLMLLVCLLYGRPLASGAMYGLAVHFRIYPVIYGPAIALFLTRRAFVQLERKQQQQARRDMGSGASRQQVDLGGGEGEETAVGPLAGGPASFSQRQGLDHNAGSAGTAAVAAGTAGTHPAPESLRKEKGKGTATRLLGARSSKKVRQGAAALRPAVVFTAGAAATFLLLGALFYGMYGNDFLQEAFLHHLTRKDPRHNFSPYYYSVYLSYGSDGAGHSASGSAAAVAAAGRSMTAGAGRTDGTPRAPQPPFVVDRGLTAWLQSGWWALRRVVPLDEPWRLALLPQAAALGAIVVRFHEDLPVAWLLQTWCFVTLNKVVTAQYFVWYLSLLPLVLPALAVQRVVSRGALAAGAAVWVASQLNWLAWAYLLEMRGKSVHLAVWASGLAFQAANTAMVVLLARALRRRRQPASASAPSFLESSLMLTRTPPLTAIMPARKKLL